jgi:hypothetical protein
MRPRARLALVGACVVSAGAGCAVALAGQASGPEVPTPAQLATLSPTEIALLDGGGPVNVVMDPNTGDIKSVSAAGAG